MQALDGWILYDIHQRREARRVTVANLRAKDAWTLATFEGRPASCFHCGKTVGDVAVLWHGHGWTGENSIDVVLHPDYATTLGIEIIGDARNARRLLDGKPITAGICQSLLAVGEA